MRIVRASLAALLLLSFLSVRAEEPLLGTWPSPPFWAPARQVESRSESSPARGALAAPVPLPFFSVAPCRLVDTRGNGAPLSGGFLPAATVRSYALVGVCGIPAGAKAISLNATAVDPVGPGFLTLWEKGQPVPPVSTLNFKAADRVANAAVVPLSPDGSVSVAFGVSGGDLVLDTNGYYAIAPGVTSLNALIGDVTLLPGANVTLTPAGNNLTISATGGPGGQLPPGASGQTLRSNGTAWIPNDALTSDGVNVTVAGKLEMGISPRATAGSLDFLHGDSATGNVGLGFDSLPVGASGISNTAYGTSSLTALSSGAENTGVGSGALNSNSTGGANSAVGSAALSANTSGNFNTAMGFFSLRSNTTASYNTAIGRGTLFLNTTGASNVAIGDMAMASNTSGPTNVAVGSGALQNNTVGSGNVALGSAAGLNVVSGSNNVFLSHQGVAGDNGVVRIGTAGSQTATFIAGIRGTTTALNDALPVVIDSAGQLGTISPTVMANVPVMVLIELQNMRRRAEAAEAGLRALEQRMAKLEAAGARAER